jgi:4-hydroxy-tetrahydrodipicolinate reductase
MIRVAISGATGRMGRLASQLVNDEADLKLHAAMDSKSSPEMMLGANVLLDLTTPDATDDLVDFACENGLKAVIGTSGWNENRIAALTKRVEQLNNGSAAIVVPNFSIGSMLMQMFASAAARFYQQVEIVESHWPGKVDSPSGTAVRTAERIRDSRAEGISPLISSVGQAARGEIVAGVPIHSLRMGGFSAQQQVIFGDGSDRLSITHEALNLDAYAAGILLCLRAAPQHRGVTVGLETLLPDART